MTPQTKEISLTASVNTTPDLLRIDIADRRSDIIALFGELQDAQQEQLAIDAWSIGMRALGNAHAQAQESRLKDVGQSLIADIDRQLRTHIESQQRTVGAVLSKFFDPKDGHVSQRLAAFVDDQGSLARLLAKHVAPQNSLLAETLARQVGEQSALFKKLSPTDSEGLIKTLEVQLAKVMQSGHGELVKALDPNAPDGAVARFLRSLRDELKRADSDRAQQLSTALSALDSNNETSLISRLAKETEQAREMVLMAVNPDAANSPMASIKNTLVSLLKEHASSQTELLRLQQSSHEQIAKDIREALARLETRRNHDKRAPQGGHSFESSVICAVGDVLLGAPCTLECTANTVGKLDRCKKGDAVARFHGESAFAGAGVIFEAKHDASFTAQRALTELDEARKNRDASVGVFVMAKSHAPDGFPSFARYGTNVLVTWDEDDSATDPYLRAAVFLGMALVRRTHSSAEPGELDALHDIERRLEAELKRLERMESCTDSIRKNADTMSDEIRKARKALDRLISDGKSTLRALHIELYDEAAERSSPITMVQAPIQ